jgi:hypothetical protein
LCFDLALNQQNQQSICYWYLFHLQLWDVASCWTTKQMTLLFDTAAVAVEGEWLPSNWRDRVPRMNDGDGDFDH